VLSKLVTKMAKNAFQNAQKQYKDKAKNIRAGKGTTQEKLDKLYNAIQPLLNNLKANPEKEYIKWPKRTEKIEQFEDHIQSIYLG